MPNGLWDLASGQHGTDLRRQGHMQQHSQWEVHTSGEGGREGRGGGTILNRRVGEREAAL